MEKMVIKLDNPADTIKVQKVLIELMQDLSSGIAYDCEIKRHREKRSLNANDYFHVLVHKLAEYMKMGNDEMKIKLNLEYGTPEKLDETTLFAVQVPKGANISKVCKYAKWYKEIIDNGIVKDCYIIYKETHTLDTKEMARLIQGTVQECQNVGIETKLIEEQNYLLSLWKPVDINK